MNVLILIIHILVCLALVGIVLLQSGKGAEMGATFGGGSGQTLFGGSGAGSFLGKATTVAAVIFMLTSLVLAYLSSHQKPSSIMERVKPPVEDTSPATPLPGIDFDASQTAPEASRPSDFIDITVDTPLSLPGGPPEGKER